MALTLTDDAILFRRTQLESVSRSGGSHLATVPHADQPSTLPVFTRRSSIGSWRLFRCPMYDWWKSTSDGELGQSKGKDKDKCNVATAMRWWKELQAFFREKPNATFTQTHQGRSKRVSGRIQTRQAPMVDATAESLLLAVHSARTLSRGRYQPG